MGRGSAALETAPGLADAAPMASGVIKRSVRIAGHATSVSLETEFWQALRDIAARRGVTTESLVAEIDAARTGNLSSAIRLFVLDCLRSGIPADTAPTVTAAPATDADGAHAPRSRSNRRSGAARR